MICISLVFLMAVGVSTAYFLMTKRDKQQQSQQRIQVAFDMLLHDMTRRIQTFSNGFEEFLNDSTAIRGAAYTYANQMANPANADILRSISLSYLLNVTEDLRKFAHIVSADRVVMYGSDASIMVMYQRTGDGETVGLSTISEAGNQTYLPLDDASEASKMLSGMTPIPDRLFPFGVPTHFYGDIPQQTLIQFFNENNLLGLRITAPIVYQEDEISGVMTADLFFTQAWIEQYAGLSQTHLNLFIGKQLSIGSFPDHQVLVDEPMASENLLTMNRLLATSHESHAVAVAPVSIQDTEYYQGICTLADANNTLYTITASVSKDVEDRAIHQVLITILTISGVIMTGAVALSLLVSRKSMQALHHLLGVIGEAASGNLRDTALVMSLDEFGVIAVKLNEMITRLRDVSLQTKAVSQKVNDTADDILREVEMLFTLMEQQVASVDNTSDAIEHIDQFIDGVVSNIQELLKITEQNLLAIQRMSITTEEVVRSTNHLNRNLQDISSFGHHVSSASTKILEDANHLLQTVQATEGAIDHIGELLQHVARNAEHSQELARETVDAALEGRSAVNVSIEGVTALKDVVEKSSRIMEDVDARSEQVGAILDFVDEIAEKTELLSLNASIISAQAGEHGRGFAVIATAIRELSAQTKHSTKKIHKVITSLRRETHQGVKSISAGMEKVDEGVRLASAASESLDSIIHRASKSSEHASHTVQMIQETLDSSELIQQSMNTLASMTGEIQAEIQKEEQDLQQVFTSIDTIRSMSEQVKHANLEQNSAATQVKKQMEFLAESLGGISEQTQHLQQSSDQIVEAMRRIEAITENILQDTTAMSQHTLMHMVRQSEDLRLALNVFQAE